MTSKGIQENIDQILLDISLEQALLADGADQNRVARLRSSLRGIDWYYEALLSGPLIAEAKKSLEMMEATNNAA